MRSRAAKGLAAAVVAGAGVLAVGVTRAAQSEFQPPGLTCTDGPPWQALVHVGHESALASPPPPADPSIPSPGPPPGWPEDEPYTNRPPKTPQEMAAANNRIDPKMYRGKMRGELRWSVVWHDGKVDGDRAYLIGRRGDEVKDRADLHRLPDGWWDASVVMTCPELERDR